MAQLTIDQAFQIALQHHQAGQLAQADQIYRQILAQQPGHAQALQYLGVLACQAGHSHTGVTLLRQAVALKPGDAEALNNLAVALQETGQSDEALAACRQAITLRPAYGEAYSNLGNALQSKDQFDAAIAAYRQAIALRPRCAEAYGNLATALKAKEQLDEAAAAAREAIAINPAYAEAYSALGMALKDSGFAEEAVAFFRRAVELKPGYAQAHSNLLYTLHFCPGRDARSIYDEHCRWNQQHAMRWAQPIRPHANDRSPDRRLRIGYVGADFRDHCQTHFMLPLLFNHDHARFEVYCYSNVANPDAWTEKFYAHFDTWRSIRRLSDDQAAELIRQDRIDILIDLTLHMADNRMLVFARKPAPVQMTWLGYPGTTGLETIDYRLSDPYLDPFDAAQGGPFDAAQGGPFDAAGGGPFDGAQGGPFDAAQGGPPGRDKFYSEATLRLPETFWCYHPLSNDPAVNELPALKNGYVTFGCLNNFCKINDPTLSLWAKVLRAIPTSRLLMLVPCGSARQRVLEIFRREGIDPNRIDFSARLPALQYRELYHRIDIGLDALPYNGHTSSLDSFWMGVPVATLVGTTAVGRAGLSQLTNLGLLELVAWDAEQYVRIVQDLAGDLPRLVGLRAGMRERMRKSPLMDGPRFTRHVEATYRQAWRKWCGIAGG